jgi:hypothetical protein
LLFQKEGGKLRADIGDDSRKQVWAIGLNLLSSEYLEVMPYFNISHIYTAPYYITSGCAKLITYRILSSHSGSYEEFYLLGYTCSAYSLTLKKEGTCPSKK